jgi:hypothetical protein
LSRIVKKAAEKKAELIGKVDLAGQVYTVAADGNMALGLVNGYKVVDANMYEDPIKTIIPVMSGILAKAYRDNWFSGLKISLYKGDWDSLGKYPSEEYLEALAKELTHLVGKANVCVLEGIVNPGEVIPNPELRVADQNLVTNLSQYSKQLDILLLALERAVDKGSSLLRVKFVDTMWGVSEVQKELESVRASYPQMEALFGKLGQNVTMSTKAINRFLYRLKMGTALTPDDRKFIGSVLIPDITNSFENIRVLVANLLKVLAPLYKLDNMFRAYTGNPVSWSVPSNLIIEFKDSFTVLLDFLVDVPVIELSTMEPLEVVQNNFTKTATTVPSQRSA